MPWDAVRLRVAAVTDDGALGPARTLAGGPAISIVQPAWRAGRRPPLRVRRGRRLVEPVRARRAGRARRHGPERRARWRRSSATRPGCSGARRTGSSTTGRCSRWPGRDGRDSLIRITAGGAVEPIEAPFTEVEGLQIAGGRRSLIGAGPHDGAVVARLDPRSGRHARRARALARDPHRRRPAPARRADRLPDVRRRHGARAVLPADQRRVPRARTASSRRCWCCPTAARRRPRRRRCRSIGRSSPRAGSPWSTWTTAARRATGARTATRSTGSGGSSTSTTASPRPGSWPSGARSIPARMAIRGGSAGGYTTLAALTFHPEVFAAGISHFGIADLELIHLDGHKFESRYDEGLLAPWPEGRQVFHDRSPIHCLRPDRRADAVHAGPGRPGRAAVPAGRDGRGAPRPRDPARDAQPRGRGPRLPQGGVPPRRASRAELSFLGQVFGFTPADAIEPIRVEHLAPVG